MSNESVTTASDSSRKDCFSSRRVSPGLLGCRRCPHGRCHSRYQRRVSPEALALGEVTDRIAVEEDYSHVISKLDDDELERLVEALRTAPAPAPA